MDLDIAHYSYDDLRALLELPSPYTKEQWKASMSVVKQTHPDKSGLDKEYFIFFRRAHVLLGAALQTRGVRGEEEELLGASERECIEQMPEQEFRSWFNRTFEELCKEEKAGYGDWLAGDEGTVTVERGGDVHSYFEKQRVSAVGRADLVVCDAGESFDTLGTTPASYSAPLFSALQYDDVRIAHSQTFIPVGQQDFARAGQHETVEERRQVRSTNDGAPQTAAAANSQLQSLREQDVTSSLQRNYNMALALERSQDNRKELKGRLLALTSNGT
jgi:hypothetical protein